MCVVEGSRVGQVDDLPSRATRVFERNDGGLRATFQTGGPQVHQKQTNSLFYVVTA